MLKVLFIIIVVAFIVGTVVLMVAVNYIVAIFRRFRQRLNGEYDDDGGEETFRRRSNQYSFKRTSYSNNAGGARGAQSQGYRQEQGPSASKEPELIVDTRDPSKVNRQIISDDEGEYVDFIEEK